MSFQSDFINKIKEPVLADSLKKKIIPSITIAQAILESNWGRSELTKKYNNFFGVKGNAGNGILLPTWEIRNGKKVYEKAYFKVYTDLEEAISDHTNLFYRVKLGNSLRYQKVINAKNFVDGARALQSCGYATDTSYADKIIVICQNWNLGRIDKEYFDLLKEKEAKKVVKKPLQKPKEVYKEHTVKKGETLSKICGTNDLAFLEKVGEINGLKNINLIYPNQKLRIPIK